MPTGKTNKRRGFSFEREIVHIANDKGLIAERAYASNGRALGEHESVDVMIAGCRVQCKRVKRLADKYRLNEHQDAVVFREDRGEPVVMLRLDDFLDKLILP